MPRPDRSAEKRAALLPVLAEAVTLVHQHSVGVHRGGVVPSQAEAVEAKIRDAEKAIIAYHEGGHAVVQRILPKCDPVQKVTIISRGMALGYTMALPEEERRLESKARLVENLAFILGGRAAEEKETAGNFMQKVRHIFRGHPALIGADALRADDACASIAAARPSCATPRRSCWSKRARSPSMG